MIKSIIRQVIPWSIYPFGISLAIGLHYFMLNLEVGTQVSTYVPILVVASVVALFEYVLPYQAKWHPNRADLKADVTYMVLVQTVLPKILGFLVALTLLRIIQPYNLSIANYWPHHSPVWFQAILMILIADFFRYWFHVLSHTNSFFWRFHAVHHSPEKLYWVNTGRFHPIEKALQFLLDAFPFILLSVEENVLALYFVFYAANGFFQHSNIELKFGILNYIISTAELHRWHHSKLTSESNSNYGNNTIIWDVLFGTRYLPRKKNVAEIGVVNPNYPKSFLEQLKTPFVRGLDKKNLPLPSFKSLIVNGLVYIKMQLIKYTSWRNLIKATNTLQVTQQATLMRILKENAGTTFGTEHRFSEINTYADYKQYVPFQTYDSLHEYFIKQDKNNEKAITEQQPVMYSVTSGTTGLAKHIPIVKSAIKENKKHQTLFTYAQYKSYPEAFSGKMLGIVGASIEGCTESGAPYGAVSGVLYESMPSILKSKYVLPDAVFSIKDYLTKYKVILRLALEHKDITYIASANPSTFIMLSALLNENKHELISDIAAGACSQLSELGEQEKPSILKYLQPNPDRAKELMQMITAKDELLIADVWPYLQLIVTWGGGSCGIALDVVKKYLPDHTKIMELGYLSSEFNGTITANIGGELGIPTIQENYFEFVERSKWESGDRDYLSLDQLVEGREYYVIITTASGLYRYSMNDIIKANRCINNTPTLSFVQKGKGVTNITGEKLYENQIIHAVKNAEKSLSFSCVNFIALADKINSNYKLYIELLGNSEINVYDLQNEVEKELFSLNIEYKEKRASDRLKPLLIGLLQQGAMDQYKKYCINNGQREGQFKFIALQYFDDIDFLFEKYIKQPE